MSRQLNSYPKVNTIGHRYLKDLFEGDVVVQEKTDGSQFSWGVLEGELHCRSRGAIINVDQPPNLFTKAVETIKTLYEEGKLVEGWQYRGEAITSPKHNTLHYSRTPDRFIMLFDVDIALETRLLPDHLEEVASNLGLEMAPVLYYGKISSIEEVKEIFHKHVESCLGGCAPEGIVVKNYNRFGLDGKMLIGKYVSEEFKEKHSKDWGPRNPSKKDIIAQIVDTYRHPRRWEKSVEHLRDEGLLEGTPKDIGKLVPMVGQDIKEECEDEIKAILFGHFWDQIRRGCVNGLAEWYKDVLMEQQFGALELELTNENNND